MQIFKKILSTATLLTFIRCLLAGHDISPNNEGITEVNVGLDTWLNPLQNVAH